MLSKEVLGYCMYVCILCMYVLYLWTGDGLAEKKYY